MGSGFRSRQTVSVCVCFLLSLALAAAGASAATIPFRLFSSTGFWNARLGASAALDPSSMKVVAALSEEAAQEEEVKEGPAINTTAWSVPIYTVPSTQPTVKVKLPYAWM